MKRIVFCFDGTWNNLNTKTATNVGITAQSIAPSGSDGKPQIVYYDEGVGNPRHNAHTLVKQIEKFGGGLFGHGLLANLVEAYKFLVFNYRPGDDIFVFGFSRGAFSARSFTGLLHSCGILRRSHAEQISNAVSNYQRLNPSNPAGSLKLAAFRWKYSKDVCVDEDDEDWRFKTFPNDFKKGQSQILRIKYLGVWDTVGSLGVPKELSLARLTNQKYQFHNTDLSTFVENARHAVAIDEKRKSFEPTLWRNIEDVNEARGATYADPTAPYQEMWFPGTHGSVGGGGSIRGLSDEPLNWIWKGAIINGLSLDTGAEAETLSVRPNYLAPLDNVDPNKKPSLLSKALSFLPARDRFPGPRALHEVSLSTRFRWAEDPTRLPGGILYRPKKTLDRVKDSLEEWLRTGASQQETKHVMKSPEFKGDEADVKKLPESHKVVPGDTLGKIAKDYYGETYYYMPLFRKNQPPLTNPDEIYVGQELSLPPKRRLDELINWKGDERA